MAVDGGVVCGKVPIFAEFPAVMVLKAINAPPALLLGITKAGNTA